MNRHADAIAASDGSEGGKVLEARAQRRAVARADSARYGAVLLLLLVTFIVLASAPRGKWVVAVTTLLQAATLVAALRAAHARRGLRRAVVIVSAVCVAAAVVAAVAGDTDQRDTFVLVDLLLVALAPVVIITGIVRRRRLDVQTVLGALCVYVLLGMFWAFTYAGINAIAGDPYFVQTAHATTSDFLYFSFVTLTTTGYGDLTAANGLGRALAVIEALIGQLYLVTVVALLVSNLPAARREA